MEIMRAYFFVILVVAVLVLPILTVAAVYWHQKREKLDQAELEQQEKELHRRGPFDEQPQGKR